MEAAGLLRRTLLPPPAASRVYELTPLGRGPIVGLARWGLQLLGVPQPGEVFRPAWLLLAMRVAFDPQAAAGLDAVYELRIDDDVLHAVVRQDTIHTADGPAPHPTVVLTMDTETLLQIVAGTLTPATAIAAGRLTLDGDPAAAARFFTLFHVGAPLQAAPASP